LERSTGPPTLAVVARVTGGGRVPVVREPGVGRRTRREPAHGPNSRRKRRFRRLRGLCSCWSRLWPSSPASLAGGGYLLSANRALAGEHDESPLTARIRVETAVSDAWAGSARVGADFGWRLRPTGARRAPQLRPRQLPATPTDAGGGVLRL